MCIRDSPYIFQRFFQSPHSGNKEGTGIGLYLVKTYTELHGGHINGVTSNEGKGTSIGLNIPVIAVEKEEIPATQVKKQLESLPDVYKRQKVHYLLPLLDYKYNEAYAYT